VADDDPHMVATLSAVLEAAGAEVGPVQRPRDALAAIREDPDAWSLLVTDYDMPGMTGAELAEAARRLRPGLPVLLCTALPDAARSHAGLFAAILPKPVSNDRLLAAAAAALAKETT
jgi:CheY-like chemotaxis protein